MSEFVQGLKEYWNDMELPQKLGAAFFVALSVAPFAAVKPIMNAMNAPRDRVFDRCTMADGSRVIVVDRQSSPHDGFAIPYHDYHLEIRGKDGTTRVYDIMKEKDRSPQSGKTDPMSIYPLIEIERSLCKKGIMPDNLVQRVLPSPSP